MRNMNRAKLYRENKNTICNIKSLQLGQTSKFRHIAGFSLLKNIQLFSDTLKDKMWILRVLSAE